MSVFWPSRREPTAGPAGGVARSSSFQAWVDEALKFGGQLYPYGGGVAQSWSGTPAERIAASFAGHVGGGYGGDAVVFGVELKRMLIFSDARFQWRRLRSASTGELFGNADLGILERPWPGGTTGDLLTRMILDADLAGNSYWARLGDELVRLRPDWVDIVLAPRMVAPGPGGRMAVTAADGAQQVGYSRAGYFYYEGGRTGDKPVVFMADEVAHFAPIPDPLATYRGMSWLTPVIREIQADRQSTSHQVAYLEHGGSPNFLIRLPAETTKAQFDLFKEAYEASHGGPENAYRTLLLTAGADATVLGSNMQQLDMKALRGQGETRIAMAGGIHPVVLGSSEGMAGSSLNAGNYTAAKRATADGTFRPLWRNAAGSMAPLIPRPPGGDPVELWYDDRHVAFLREDVRDQAEVAAKDAQIIRQLGDGGWDPESIKAAMAAGYDWSLLKHSGLVPVQLNPPGAGQVPAA